MTFKLMIRPLGNAHFVLALLLALAASAGTRCGQTASTAQEMLWYWLPHCRDGKMMRLEVVLNGKPIYQSSFGICRLRPADGQTGQIGRTVAFTFRAGHLFQGGHRTVPTQTIKGSIWQAGGEPDGLLLGVSFSTKDRVLLNSVHFVKPDSTSESKLDAGLFIRTHPLASSHP